MVKNKCGLLLFIIAAIAVYYTGLTAASENHSKILTSCVKDIPNLKMHYHVNLHIIYFNQPYAFPKAIGLEEGCDHPIQVHDDADQQIHIHYSQLYPFTLGDFFTTWGVIFNKNQFGATMAGRRYSISMKVNGRSNKDFERYILKNNDNIELTISKK